MAPERSSFRPPGMALSGLLLAACSLTFQKTAPWPAQLGATPACDRGSGLPIADAALTALSAAVVAYDLYRAFTCSDEAGTDPGCGPTNQAFVLMEIVVPVVFAYSSHTGFRQKRRCRDLTQRARPLGEGAGLPGGECIPLENGTDICLDGSRCIAGVCKMVPVFVHPAMGSPCEPIPGVPRGGRCPRGLVCRGQQCLP